VKDEPVDVRLETWTRLMFWRFTMVTVWFGKAFMVPVAPFMVVVHCVNVTRPKFASVPIRMPTVGRSTIHSADSLEDGYVGFFWNVWPFVVSCIWMDHVLLVGLMRIIDAVMWSCCVMFGELRVSGFSGNSSYHVE